MTKIIRESWILSLLLSALALAAQVAAQDRAPKKIYWGVSTLSPNLWIPWLAKEAKIFEKNGLDVEPVLLRGSGQTSQAMVAGSLFASSFALPAVMLADLNADLVNVAHGMQRRAVGSWLNRRFARSKISRAKK
jgi:ABC-type nitrate/sulfonate/bicarbonate transport system substrate-binding protein